MCLVSNIPPKRILVVDDNEDHLYLTKSRLEMENSNFDVEVVQSGEECLMALESGEFDCIISDYDMRPGMNGLDLLKTLRNREIDTPFIVISAVGDHEIEARARKSGAVDYIDKSDGYEDFNSIVRSIKRAIGRRGAAQEKEAAVSSRPGQERDIRPFTESNDFGVVINIEGQKIEGANRAADEMMGQSEGGLIGEAIASLVVPEHRTDLRRLIILALKGEQATGVIHFIRPGGKTRPMRVVCAAKQVKGKIVGAYISARAVKENP